MRERRGILVISLDFELFWGLRDVMSVKDYRENLLGVHTVVPRLLELFEEYGIHATWAAVGFLFLNNRDEIIASLPEQRPKYIDETFSAYGEIENLGFNEDDDPYHYAPSLIKLISNYAFQEIGSHTFSHYYCLEAGQDPASFRADLEAAVRAARSKGLSLKSLVFPRNQINTDYLNMLSEFGFKAYRGNPSSLAFAATTGKADSLFRRLLRLADAYINLTGHNSYPIESVVSDVPFNIPASRFLRPYTNKLQSLEPLRMRRIKNDLTYAAHKGEVYHLWWHPHNFGADQEKNLSFLRSVFDHFSYLKKNFGMQSLNMSEMTQEIERRT